MPGATRSGHSTCAARGKRVQVRGVSGLKLAPARLGMGKATKTVNDEQDYPGVSLATDIVQVWEVNHG